MYVHWEWHNHPHICQKLHHHTTVDKEHRRLFQVNKRQVQELHADWQGRYKQVPWHWNQTAWQKMLQNNSTILDQNNSSISANRSNDCAT